MLEKRQAELAAPLGIKLRGSEIAALDGSADAIAAVVAFGKCIARIGGFGSETMHEIEGGPLAFDRREDRVVPAAALRRGDHFGPTDMRNPLRLAVDGLRRDEMHAARQYAQPFGGAELLAAFKEHLHADANARIGRSLPMIARMASSNPRRCRAETHSPKAPTPGTTSLSAARASAADSVTVTSAPTASNARDTLSMLQMP